MAIFYENVNSIRKFMKPEMVDEDIVQSTVDHYDHVWKKSLSYNIEKFSDNLHPDLQKDFTYFLFGDVLKDVDLFSGAEESFYQLLGVHLRQVYVKKDEDVIRCNDVQGMLYIIMKGNISITVAYSNICHMQKGGIFGNFTRHSKIRQTILAQAQVHTSLLMIEGPMFHNIIKDYPEIVKRVEKVIAMRYEFQEPKQSTKRRLSIEADNDADSKSYRIWRRRGIKLLVKPDSTFFKYYDIIMNVHLACLSSMFLLHMIVIHPSPYPLYYTVTKYFLDCLYFSKIIIYMHLIYIDPESGIKVEDLRKIRKRYIKSTFILDVFTVIPIALIITYIPANLQSEKEYFELNRVFRFFYLFIHAAQRKKKISSSQLFRWFYLLYVLTFLLQFLTCIWWVTACPTGFCYYLKDSDAHKPSVYLLEKDRLASMILAYKYVITVFTTSSLRDICPLTIAELGVSMMITFTTIYATASLTSAFASILVTQNCSMRMYEHKIEEMTKYIQVRCSFNH